MADGFEENAEFFNLTYEDPDLVGLGRKFEAVAPLLVAEGRWAWRAHRRSQPTTGSLPDGAIYGVLFDGDKWREFVEAVVEREATMTARLRRDASPNDAFQQIAERVASGHRLPPSSTATTSTPSRSTPRVAREIHPQGLPIAASADDHRDPAEAPQRALQDDADR